MWSGGPTLMPGVLASTTNTEMPAAPLSGAPLRANTMNKLAIGALVMNRLDPLMTQLSPSLLAVVVSVLGSEPASSSVSANDAVISPDAMPGR